MTSQKASLQPYASEEKVRQTLQSLDTIDDTSLVSISTMGIETVRSLKQEIATIFPASNLPAFLLQGLIQLQDRTIQSERLKTDLNMLFRRTSQVGAYSVLAAPALVIYGYQRILALAGKDVDEAFPDGYWQFYTEFGLREDAARHCVEAIGFHEALRGISDVDAATCWVWTAMRTMLDYDDMLANEWNEHRWFRSLHETLSAQARRVLDSRRSSSRKSEEHEQAIAEHVAELRRKYKLEQLETTWAAQRPYSVPSDDPLVSYPAYRQKCFAAYKEKVLKRTPAELYNEIEEHHRACEEQECHLYQQQMTLVVSLHADAYQEYRTLLHIENACVAMLAGKRYYLLPVCRCNDDGNPLVFPSKPGADSAGTPLNAIIDGYDRGQPYDRYKRLIRIGQCGRVWAGHDRLGRLLPPPLDVVKRQVQEIVRLARTLPLPNADNQPVDILLTETPRHSQPELRKKLDKETRKTIERLRSASIIINWDEQPGTHSLGDIRRTQRGCGDHALTLLRTDRSMVFDMSHICFDGVWGTALAEIMTSRATALYPQIAEIRASQSAPVPEPLTLNIPSDPRFVKAIYSANKEYPVEVCVETNAIDLESMLRLRKRLKKIELPLTINDLLILARCLHAASYQPRDAAQEVLDRIPQEIGTMADGQDMRGFIEEKLEEQREINPALLIPMDATAIDPRMRIYPATFRNPVHELPQRIAHCSRLVQSMRRRTDAHVREEFERERRNLYRDLHTFGTLLETLKQVTMRGESFTIACLRLLSHLPDSLQYLLDRIPQKIDMLNEVIKGREVFSNVGRVVRGSSVVRFFSSRDDGETKWLVWGILTSAHGQLTITLRDFRPFVKPLVQLGHTNFARILAQDYLDTYAMEANSTVRRIQRIFGYKSAMEQ